LEVVAISCNDLLRASALLWKSLQFHAMICSGLQPGDLVKEEMFGALAQMKFLRNPCHKKTGATFITPANL
jgi:hypothetical protein